MESNPATAILRDWQRRLLTRRVARVSAAFAGIAVFVSLCCYIRVAAMVDHALQAGLFERRARIYAAEPESPTQPRSSVDQRVVRISLSGSTNVPVREPELMANFFDASRARRRLVTFEEIPETLIKAVLSGEDRNFFQHFGVSPRRILGAMVSNLRPGGPTQGGSTITQQLARSLFLSREHSLRRKLSEAVIALVLETRLTKEQILTMYANEIYLGNRDSFAIHGFAEGAKAYFGKDLSTINLAEAATLAGIIPAPNAYSPVVHPERAKTRRNLILRIMRDTGAITGEQYDEASTSDLLIAKQLDPTEGQYLVDYVQEELLKDFSREELMDSGLRVYTTVEPELQKAAIDSVNFGLRIVNDVLAKRHRGNKASSQISPQAGLIALDPRTGEIKAMVGGTSYGSSQYNRMTRASRQPGSIFKPFVYAAALETSLEGYSEYDLNPNDDRPAAPITAATPLLDEPTVFYNSSADKDYAPKNYGGEYRGSVSLRSAFQKSLNVPTVFLAQSIGYDRVAQLARRMGMNSSIRAYPSVALGAFEVTPLEIAGAYTAFANDGKRVEPHALRRVTSADGKELKAYEYQPEQVIHPKIAYLVTHLMEGVLNYGTGAGVRGRGFLLPAAGKTGTSRDGWFAGFTKDLLVITWVGYDDNRDLDLEGARSALPIWAEFMKKAYRIHPPQGLAKMFFRPPPGIEFVQIDKATLLRADPSCGESFEEAFIRGTAPAESCLDD